MNTCKKFMGGFSSRVNLKEGDGEKKDKKAARCLAWIP